MTAVTIIGNLTAPPELRFTAQGKAVASFTIAEGQRVRDADGTWRDGDSTFWRCTMWDAAAENLTESLDKGQRVIAYGEAKQRSFETKSGEKRTVIEVTVTEIGPSLRWATARPEKAARGQSGPKKGPSSADVDPWASSPAADADEAPF